MVYIKTSLIFLSLILFSNIYAQNLENIYSDILITYSKIVTYEANFSQKNYWKELDVSMQSNGNIYYDENHLLLQYKKPNEQLLLIDHDFVTIFNPTSNQAVISNNAESDIRPINFISKYWNISQKTLIDSNKSKLEIKLVTPESEQIFINLENYLIVDFSIIDADTNSVHYSFASEKINHNLPENIFKLALPDDVNIIDTRNEIKKEAIK